MTLATLRNLTTTCRHRRIRPRIGHASRVFPACGCLLHWVPVQLLTRELFSPSRGLFSYNSGVRSLWFQQQEEAATPTAQPSIPGASGAAEEAKKRPAEAPAVGAGDKGTGSPSESTGGDVTPTGKAKEYWLTGLLASIAVYNDILMPLNLPLVVSCTNSRT